MMLAQAYYVSWDRHILKMLYFYLCTSRIARMPWAGNPGRASSATCEGGRDLKKISPKTSFDGNGRGGQKSVASIGGREQRIGSIDACRHFPRHLLKPRVSYDACGKPNGSRVTSGSFVFAIGSAPGPHWFAPSKHFCPQGVIGGVGCFLGSTGLTRRR
jgi:hypothetical protein